MYHMSKTYKDQPVTRNEIARLAWERNGAGAHGRKGKGRDKRDGRTRQDVRASLRRNSFDSI